MKHNCFTVLKYKSKKIETALLNEHENERFAVAYSKHYGMFSVPLEL